MRNHYNIILFDGSFFLYRNQCVGRSLSGPKLAGSLIQTVSKLLRDFDIYFDVGFLAFDKSPYHRTNILNDKYKDNREKFSHDDIVNLSNRINSASSEQEKEKLIKEKNHIEDAINKRKIRNEAIGILSNLNNFGFKLLRYRGWEADDLARLISDMYGDKYSILVISIDSDWAGLVSENVDYLRVRHKGIVEFYDKNSIKCMDLYQSMVEDGMEEMGLGWYLQVMESMGIGHNNMRKCWNQEHPVIIPEIMASWDDLHKLEVSHGFDANTFRNQLSTFDITKFPDYHTLEHELRNFEYKLNDLSEFNDVFIYKYLTGINSKYYNNVYKRIRNYSLLQLC